MFKTRKEAADKLRDLYQDPHPRKFREIFTADSIPVLIELLDPPLQDDQVREAAKALLGARAGTASEGLDALRRLDEALATTPPSLAHELRLTRRQLAEQGSQLFRLGVAMQLARTFGMSDVKLPGSEVVVPFLRGWMDDGTWPALAFPDAGELPAVASFLTGKGYANIDGAIGLWLTSNRVDPELGRDFVL